jgi:hypothetical protein
MGMTKLQCFISLADSAGEYDFLRPVISRMTTKEGDEIFSLEDIPVTFLSGFSWWGIRPRDSVTNSLALHFSPRTLKLDCILVCNERGGSTVTSWSFGEQYPDLVIETGQSPSIVATVLRNTVLVGLCPDGVVQVQPGDIRSVLSFSTEEFERIRDVDTWELHMHSHIYSPNTLELTFVDNELYRLSLARRLELFAE